MVLKVAETRFILNQYNKSHQSVKIIFYDILLHSFQVKIHKCVECCYTVNICDYLADSSM